MNMVYTTMINTTCRATPRHTLSLLCCGRRARPQHCRRSWTECPTARATSHAGLQSLFHTNHSWLLDQRVVWLIVTPPWLHGRRFFVMPSNNVVALGVAGVGALAFAVPFLFRRRPLDVRSLPKGRAAEPSGVEGSAPVVALTTYGIASAVAYV